MLLSESPLNGSLGIFSDSRLSQETQAYAFRRRLEVSLDDAPSWRCASLPLARLTPDRAASARNKRVKAARSIKRHAVAEPIGEVDAESDLFSGTTFCQSESHRRPCRITG